MKLSTVRRPACAVPGMCVLLQSPFCLSMNKVPLFPAKRDVIGKARMFSIKHIRT